MADKPTVPSFTGNATFQASKANELADDLATAVEGCLGRGGTGESPNSMTGNLDMDINKITNLGTPTADGDAVTKAYGDTNYGGSAAVAAAASAVDAEAAQAAAETAETNAAASEAKAEDWAEEAEDVEVETGKYSALHWAAKSAAETIDLPTGVAETYLKRNAGNTAYETKTPAQVADDLIVQRDFRGKNELINGNFDEWQRGTSQIGSGYKSADRWRMSNTTSTFASSKQLFSIGQSDVPNNPESFHRTVVTSNIDADAQVQILQKIEGVRALAGQTATISFWAKADSSNNLAVEMSQGFGTGGSPSADVIAIVAQKIALTTSWQKFTVEATIPSISGKSLGTDNNDFLRLAFWLDAGSNLDARTDSLGQQSGTYDIAQVQLEEGTVATDFEQRHISQELALCQRYYLPVSPQGAFVERSTTAGTGRELCVISFPVEMRVEPTVTELTAPTYDNCNSAVWIVSKADGACRVTATGAPYRAINGLWGFDSEL